MDKVFQSKINTMKWLIIFILTLYGNIVNCQEYTKIPIPIIDIEKGLNDFKYFRAVLLENGFQYKDKDTLEDASIREFWEIPSTVEYHNNSPIYLQISIWKYDYKKKGNDIDLFKKNLPNYSIAIHIRKEYAPKYAEQFSLNLKKAFPIKEAIPIIRTINNGDPKENYSLIYTRQGSNIKVEYEESEYDFNFTFNKYLYWSK